MKKGFQAESASIKFESGGTISLQNSKTFEIRARLTKNYDVGEGLAVLARDRSLREQVGGDAPLGAERLETHRGRERVDARSLGDDECDAVLSRDGVFQRVYRFVFVLAPPVGD